MPALYRLPWADFPDVVLHTNLPTLEAHPAYLSAKMGNPEAAIQLAKDLIVPDKISFPGIDAVVPVVRADAGEKNAIPIAAAAILAQRLNLEPIASITQTNDVGHTKANAPVRILGQPTFAGKIRPYARVLIVDDVLSYGSTIANLRGWIHQQRAVAVGCTCIAASFGATVRPICVEPVADTRAQRPEPWSLYNGRIKKGEQVRVFPLSNWTELDVWRYIELEDLELPSIYYAHEREVFERDGILLAVSEYAGPQTGETSGVEWVRYRTVGDLTITGAVRSQATDITRVIAEIAAATVSERGETRADDRTSAAAMEDRKREGYF